MGQELTEDDINFLCGLLRASEQFSSDKDIFNKNPESGLLGGMVAVMTSFGMGMLTEKNRNQVLKEHKKRSEAFLKNLKKEK
jgi:hypothetical protein